MSSWNSGRIIGQKPPLKPKEVWAIRTRLQMLSAVRDLALFNLAIICSKGDKRLNWAYKPDKMLNPIRHKRTMPWRPPS
ncbi:hypothetical protein I6F26_32805 [Ensifer sp. IC3342]|nr:hypothetical protein [Ensifer sp. BRP08]MCA1451216.1 hypothetical protein [Ensifer sp. IC3342]